ncbi:hypothetical protein ACGFNP_37270 [Nonomuraea sp. NPDC049269]|uniref:hypothetical protein n=1 Tax=Nonomuraea sp. NPDC049269 TaxID=3364349 RepID=UPI0037193C9D
MRSWEDHRMPSRGAKAIAALTLAASVLTGAPAAGAGTAPDPVAAMQRQLVKGHGVRIDQRDTFNSGLDWDRLEPEKGVIGFGNGKVVATDLRDYNSAKRGTRNLCIGERGWQYKPKGLPHGKTWVTYKWPCQLAVGSEYIRLDEPATFKAVLATTTSRRPAGTYDGTRTTLYQGTITFGQLNDAHPAKDISPLSKPEYADWTVSWRLWIGQDQLVRRAWSKWREPETEAMKGATSGQGWFGFVCDVHLSDWGMKADIQPPPRDRTATIAESKR